MTTWTDAEGSGTLYSSPEPTASDLASSIGSSLIGFLQSGSSALARTMQSKGRDFVSVLDFIPASLHSAIAAGSDSTNLVTYLQAAIDAAGERILFWPNGTYTIGSGLTTTVGRFIHWVGEHPRFTIIKYTGGASPVITFTTETQPIFECIRLENTGSATVGIQCNSLYFHARDFWWNPAVKFSTAMIQSRTDAGVEHWSIRDCYLGGSTGQRSPIGIYIHTGNAILLDSVFTDGLVCGAQIGKTAGVGFDSGLVQGFTALNCMMECGDAAIGGAIGIDLYHVDGFNISGGYYLFSDGAVAPSDLGIKCRQARGGTIHGAVFIGDGNQNYAIQCADSSARNIKIENNAFVRHVLGGSHITAGTDIWTDNNFLTTTPVQAVQTNNTWTPVLTFGGASVGITYAANGQTGRYFRRGNTMFIEGIIILTSKGSSAGAAQITGLPKAGTDITNLAGTVAPYIDNMTSISGAVIGIVSNSETLIRLYHTQTGAAATLADTNFGNGTQMYFNFTYQVVDN